MSGLKLFEAKKYLAQHLAELGCLLGRPVRADELLTLEETEAIRFQSKQIRLTPTWRQTIPFESRGSRTVVDLFQRLHDSRLLPVYVWTPLSNVCGLARPIRLVEVNLEFDFNINREGIIAFIVTDLLDKVVFDFSAKDGHLELEIEASGDHWGRLELPHAG